MCQAFTQSRLVNATVYTTRDTCTLAGLQPHTQYNFTVQAYYQQQHSSANQISAFTMSMPVQISGTLPAPNNLVVVNQTSSTISLRWEPVENAQVISPMSPNVIALCSLGVHCISND